MLQLQTYFFLLPRKIVTERWACRIATVQTENECIRVEVLPSTLGLFYSFLLVYNEKLTYCTLILTRQCKLLSVHKLNSFAPAVQTFLCDLIGSSYFYMEIELEDKQDLRKHITSCRSLNTKGRPQCYHKENSLAAVHLFSIQREKHFVFPIVTCL